MRRLFFIVSGKWLGSKRIQTRKCAFLGSEDMTGCAMTMFLEHREMLLKAIFGVSHIVARFEVECH
jgi:hypothetical protein